MALFLATICPHFVKNAAWCPQFYCVFYSLYLDILVDKAVKAHLVFSANNKLISILERNNKWFSLWSQNGHTENYSEHSAPTIQSTEGLPYWAKWLGRII